jgi:predicted transcriptional regulator
MVERSIQQKTLRECFTDSERLTREFVEHLEQGFLPKAHRFLDLLEVTEENRLEDISVRNSASRALESENFTEQLCEKLFPYLEMIEKNVSKIVTEG